MYAKGSLKAAEAGFEEDIVVGVVRIGMETSCYVTKKWCQLLGWLGCAIQSA